MDTDVVIAKLDSLRRCIRRIEEKTPSSEEILKDDFDLRVYAARVLEYLDIH